jgi:hypothetical protein
MVCLTMLIPHNTEMSLVYCGSKTSILYNIKIISDYGVSLNVHSS